jgi:hypothetical protein
MADSRICPAGRLGNHYDCFTTELSGLSTLTVNSFSINREGEIVLSVFSDFAEGRNGSEVQKLGRKLINIIQ